MRIFLKTYGCQMNEADSEVMGRLLEREEIGHNRHLSFADEGML
jgi:tRNA A37 methylthiotransferase MiaB